jgi:putative ABC transport system ATP-binding protein
MDHRPDELSGGQQQRVAIARALASRPLIILADEPTANLDFRTGESVIKLLASLCRQHGVTIVSATHDHKMLATSDRILWIQDGSIRKVETAEEARVNVGSIE